jgi:hypothetical protein
MRICDMEFTEKEYILLDRIVRRLDKLEKAFDRLADRLDRINTQTKIATGQAQVALVEVSKVKGKKVRADIVHGNKIRNFPSAQQWIDYMKESFVLISIMEVDKRYREGTMMTTDTIRHALSIRFGNHLADEKFLTNYTLNRFIREAGFRTGVKNMFSTSTGLKKYGNIVLCIKK